MFDIFSKINVIKIISGHVCTFGYRSSVKVFIGDILLFFAVPIFGGGVYGWFQYIDCISGIPTGCWDTAITIASIFTPLTLTLLTSLYAMKDKLESNDRAMTLFHEVIYNICYAIVVSIIMLIVAVVVKALKVESTVCGSSIFIALFSHLILSLLMIIKRFFKLFLEAVDPVV